jgi:hypothetical protein
MKKYSQINITLNESEMAFSDLLSSKTSDIYNDDMELDEISLVELGKKGQLADYLKSNTIKFGMLKALYMDAVEYKKKREYTKGFAKFAMRIIPLAIAPVFFPIWLISQILGTTRAVNKILVPTLTMNHINYKSFITTLITKTMQIAEGDIKPFMEKDWYYDVFYVHDKLIQLVRKEHIYEFTLFIAEEIQKKDDNEDVPKFWLDNEFRKWINIKFELDLPIGKQMIKHISEK